MKALTPSIYTFENLINNLVLSTEKCTYVIELKVNKTARKAMAQIWDRDYVRGFLGQGREVVAIGVNFNARKAQIDNWLVERLMT